MSLDSQTYIKRSLKNGCFGKLAIPCQTTSLCLQQIQLIFFSHCHCFNISSYPIDQKSKLLHSTPFFQLKSYLNELTKCSGFTV